MPPPTSIARHSRVWFDPGLSADKQLDLVEQIAEEKWDFVAIQAVDINTITRPVVKLIKAGIPVIDMDTLIAPLDQIDVLTFLAPDSSRSRSRSSSTAHSSRKRTHQGCCGWRSNS